VDVAERLGKPQSFVAKVESGERRIDLIDALNICACIGADPHDVIDKMR
jgi:hypothetical protein